MAANNNITIIGYAGADPEVKTYGEKVHARFRVAVSRIGKDAPTDWFEINVWGKLAERVQKHLTKGSLVSVTGSCNIDEWLDKNGNKRVTVKVQADHFQFVGPKPDSERVAPAKTAGKAAAPWEEEDEIPEF